MERFISAAGAMIIAYMSTHLHEDDAKIPQQVKWDQISGCQE
jgi:hypothetical protein